MPCMICFDLTSDEAVNITESLIRISQAYWLSESVSGDWIAQFE